MTEPELTESEKNPTGRPATEPAGKLLKTGEVLKRSGISREVFYRYLTIGLIHESGQTEGGHNLFDESVLQRLALVQQLNRSGYALRDIKDIFFKDERA